jgi:DNA helicase-2/ATP-dependent DNA helicase PcrA
MKGPALVLAGAGSGKTRILTLRILNLVKSQTAGSDEILALTFTNKAADEIKERLYKMLGSDNVFSWMGTFHSISYKILRIFVDELSPDYKKGFTIYDSNDQTKLIKDTIKALDLNVDQYPPALIKTMIDNLKNSQPYDDWKIEDKNRRNIIDTYQKKLKENNSMDFGDLILNCYELVSKNQKVRNYLRKIFRFILIDEYQDTNEIQFKLIKLLLSDEKNLFVVGDDNQLIYGWRGASVDTILNFESLFPNTKLYKLEQNYRSTPQILDVANNLIANNKKRMDKDLWTSNSKGELVELISHRSDIAEAEYVSKKIKSYNKNFKLSEIAVFYRTNAQSRVLEDQLRKSKINYKIFGNISFYDRAEIKDMICYLRLIVNPNDSVAFNRIINTPARGIGAKTLQKMIDFKLDDINYIDLLKKSLESRIFSKKSEVHVVNLIGAIDTFILSLKNGVLISECTEQFLIDLKYQEYLKDEDRIENISEFINVISDWEEVANNNDLSEFLNTLSISSSVDGLDTQSESITLMTIHLAKGLEFPCVFFVGLEDQIVPHSRTHDNENELEEERRLCYVAITRAIKKLHLSYALFRKVFGQIMPSTKSRFVEEIAESENIMRFDENSLEINNNAKTEKVFHYRFGSGYIVYDDDAIEDVVLVQFDSGFRKKVFLYDLESN